MSEIDEISRETQQLASAIAGVLRKRRPGSSGRLTRAEQRAERREVSLVLRQDRRQQKQRHAAARESVEQDIQLHEQQCLAGRLPRPRESKQQWFERQQRHAQELEQIERRIVLSRLTATEQGQAVKALHTAHNEPSATPRRVFSAQSGIGALKSRVQQRLAVIRQGFTASIRQGYAAGAPAKLTPEQARAAISEAAAASAVTPHQVAYWKLYEEMRDTNIELHDEIHELREYTNVTMTTAELAAENDARTMPEEEEYGQEQTAGLDAHFAGVPRTGGAGEDGRDQLTELDWAQAAKSPARLEADTSRRAARATENAGPATAAGELAAARKAEQTAQANNEALRAENRALRADMGEMREQLHALSIAMDQARERAMEEAETVQVNAADVPIPGVQDLVNDQHDQPRLVPVYSERPAAAGQAGQHQQPVSVPRERAVMQAQA